MANNEHVENNERGPRPISRRDFFKLAGAFAAGLVASKILEHFNPAEQTQKILTTPTATPTATATETPIATAENSPPKENKLPYFEVQGAPNLIEISIGDERLANNGPDHAGNDHKNPFMPESAAWLVLADPGHYRVDSLAHVTDPQTRASIERDIRNGAAFEGDDYKDVLTGKEAVIPLWEAGGGQVLTGAQMQIELTDANGNPVVFQLGRQENHGWVAILANGLNRDHIRGTDNNRFLKLTNYDPGFTMWQAIPPGLFISAQFAAQTIADAHGSYRSRGTSPGQGQDGVENVSILVAKILPEGVVYTVLKHNNPNIAWDKYEPNQFYVYKNNTKIIR